MKINFQFILVIVFVIAAIAGILVFSGAIPIGREEEGSLGKVVVWGTIPSQVISGPLEELNDSNPRMVVSYEEKQASTFERELLEAMATGKGPDLFFLPDNLAYYYSDKIFMIPYGSYPLSTFKRNFASAGEVFLGSKGIMAFPMAIDPIMMYYNRNILDSNGIIYPPATWEDMVLQVPSLTKKDDAGRILKSTVALGQSENIRHSKEILAALFMQAGNPIVLGEAGEIRSTLASSVGSYNLPSILEFYTSFADPNHPAYSWNRSFADSLDAFSSENLAYYFGYASELETLVDRNPNQNFFIAGVPQIKDSNFKVTSAKVIGLAVSSRSKNFNAAFTAASIMATSNFAKKFADAQNIAPARRDLLGLKPEDAYSPVIYDSALYARTWLDPSPLDTGLIWRGMINSVLSNGMEPREAIGDAGSKLDLLLVK